jgi:hypothetical protein
MPMSRRRENHLVTYIESKAVAEMLKTQALLSAHLIPVPMTKNMIKETFNTFKSYVEILLPSTVKQVNIKDITKLDVQTIKDNIKKFKERLANRPK